MAKGGPLRAAGALALAVVGAFAAAEPTWAQDELCVECLQIRVGPPTVVRGPFPDELDAAFTALKLSDGSFRAFTANGSTYAVDGATLWDMGGQRREVLQAGPPGSLSDCGRWLTTAMRSGGIVLGLVHQERICDYGPQGHTDKSMAIATSSDDGLTWTDLGTVITGRDSPQPVGITGEGDCSMVDGRDGYLYAYCLRNSDWQTIVARAPATDPTTWHKYHEGGWNEPGRGGMATAIGFVGTGTGYLLDQGVVVAVATDRWFGGLRLSLSADKVSFVDLKEPLLPIDGSDWNRPADTDLSVYATVVNPEDGSNAIGQRFLLSYIYVPPGKGFESRYLVHHEVSMSVERGPIPVQVGMALSRWTNAGRDSYVTSSGPLTGEWLGFGRDAVVAYMLTRAPDGVETVKLAECSGSVAGRKDQMLAEDGRCDAGYVRERTAGWLYAAEQPGTVPVYRCAAREATVRFASSAPDCEGLGVVDALLGYGIAP